MGHKARSLVQGLQLGIGLREQRRKGSITAISIEAKRAEIEQERSAMLAISNLNKTEKSEIQSRSTAINTLKGIVQLSKIPKGIRAPHVDAMIRKFEAENGVKIADNVGKTLKSGSTEDILPIFSQLSNVAIGDKGFNMEKLVPILTNPTIATQGFILANNNLVKQADGTVTAPVRKEPTPQERLSETIQKLQKRRDALEDVIIKYPTTKTAKSYQNVVNRIDSRIQALRKGSSPIGKLVEDFRLGRISNEQFESGIKQAGRAGKTTISDFVVRILEKIKVSGFDSLSKKDFDILIVARTSDVLDQQLSRRIVEVMRNRNEATVVRPSKKLGSVKSSTNIENRRKEITKQILSAQEKGSGFNENSPEVKSVVDAQLRKEGL